MCFGLLVTKWRILKVPLSIKLGNIPHLFGAIARLHNLYINRSEAKVKINKTYHVSAELQLPHEPTTPGYIPSDALNVINREGSSVLRDILWTHVYNNNLKRPVCESLKNALIQKRNSLNT